MAAMTTSASAIFVAAPAAAPRRAAKGLSASSSSAMRGEATAAYFDVSARSAAAGSSSRQQLRVVAGNTSEGGIFAPIVEIVRSQMGVKEFNQFRGKAISLHSQVWAVPAPGWSEVSSDDLLTLAARAA